MIDESVRGDRRTISEEERQRTWWRIYILSRRVRVEWGGLTESLQWETSVQTRVTQKEKLVRRQPLQQQMLQTFTTDGSFVEKRPNGINTPPYSIDPGWTINYYLRGGTPLPTLKYVKFAIERLWSNRDNRDRRI